MEYKRHNRLTMFIRLMPLKLTSLGFFFSSFCRSSAIRNFKPFLEGSFSFVIASRPGHISNKSTSVKVNSRRTVSSRKSMVRLVSGKGMGLSAKVEPARLSRSREEKKNFFILAQACATRNEVAISREKLKCSPQSFCLGRGIE